jgi:hypothetical protein
LLDIWWDLLYSLCWEYILFDHSFLDIFQLNEDFLGSCLEFLQISISLIFIRFAEKHKLIEELLRFPSIQKLPIPFPINFINKLCVLSIIEAANRHHLNSFFPLSCQLAHEGIFNFKYFLDELFIGKQMLFEEVGDTLQSGTFAKLVFHVWFLAVVILAMERVFLALIEGAHFL